MEVDVMDLDILREGIDKIDQELVNLLEKRMQTVLEIAKYKYENKLSVLDQNREEQVIEKNLARLKNKELSLLIEEILKTIMKSSRSYQSKFIDDQKNR